jgi:hypothetical protein
MATKIKVTTPPPEKPPDLSKVPRTRISRDDWLYYKHGIRRRGRQPRRGFTARGAKYLLKHKGEKS